jgi:hypothetical protein
MGKALLKLLELLLGLVGWLIVAAFGVVVAGCAFLLGFALAVWSVAMRALVGAAAGALVGYLLGYWPEFNALGIISQLGLKDVEVWQLGLFVGFIGGLFKPRLVTTTSSEKKSAKDYGSGDGDDDVVVPPRPRFPRVGARAR